MFAAQNLSTVVIFNSENVYTISAGGSGIEGMYIHRYCE